MNKLPLPKFDDFNALDNLISTRCKIKKEDKLIIASNKIYLYKAYKKYIKKNGFLTKSAHHVNIPDILGDILKRLYKSPPKSIGFIDELRNSSASLCCSMCGSLHSGQLDHVLPKDSWAQFSILTKNLVPACKCNGIKGSTASGNINERFLHPYYDEILSKRLISINIRGLSSVPYISIRILTNQDNDLHESVKLHTNNIVLKNGILNYQVRRWEVFYNHPESIVRGLTPQLDNYRDIKKLLIKELRLTDKARGSKNNWDSVFISGLINKKVIEWILIELSNPDRSQNGELKKYLTVT